MAFLKSEGTVPDSREVFMILTKVGNKGSTHSFTILVGMGSSWHDFVGALSMIFFRSSADMGGKYVSLGVFLSSCDVSSIPCCAFTSPSCNFCTFPVKKSAMSFDNSSLFSLSGKHEVRVRFKSWSTQLNRAFWESSDSVILREKWFFFASLMVFVRSFLDLMNRSVQVFFQTIVNKVWYFYRHYFVKTVLMCYIEDILHISRCIILFFLLYLYMIGIVLNTDVINKIFIS